MKKNILVGKTKIVLTDIRTGEVKTYEDKNTFQNTVVADYMRPLGAYNNSPYANSTWAGQEMWRNLAGGLLLFRDAIDLTGGPVKYMPAGNEMVGNGAYGVVNNSTPTELGSYNSTESQTTGSDSVSMVYDFTSSQANGTIGCICLTTETGGYIGYGNKSGDQASTIKHFTNNQSSRGLTGIIYKNARYSFGYDFGNAKVIVSKTPTEVTQGSIFDGLTETSYEIAVTGSMPVNWGTVWPCYIGAGKVALFMFDNGGLIGYLNAGATYTFVVVDIENETAQSYTITNSYSAALMMHAGYSDNMAFGVLAIDDNHIFFASGSNWDGPIIGINYKTDQLTYTLPITTFTRPTNRNFQFFGGQIGNSMIGFWVSPGSFVLDKQANTFYPVNGDISGCNYNDDIEAFSYHGGGGRYTTTLTQNAIKNPLMLTTVNNLDSPVTKTANQTMKVTYTLTKVVV